VLPASQAVAFLSPWWQPSTREKKGQQRQQALHLSRAMQRQAIMPVVFKYCAVVSAGRGSAALAGLTLLTSDAAPSHRSGRDEVLCSLSVCEKGQQPQQASFFSRAMQRQAGVPFVITYRAAVSACVKDCAL